MQGNQKSTESRTDFKQWIISCGKTVGYSIAMSICIIIPLNGVAHILGTGILY